MTKKLYYENAYIREFDARVISVEPCGDKYHVVLDATAFFPNEGGQSADRGFIDSIAVLGVEERGGVIYHVMAERPKSEYVHGIIDFDNRIEKMRAHTAEHMLCGIIHRLYGYENVGFHIGDDMTVTFDVDGELNAERIAEIELLANKAVMENRGVRAFLPSAEDLKLLEYRAKLDIMENVRIVEIDGVDVCACCAPHVSRTGEIGAVKIVDFIRHRGGMRLFMVAGESAMADYGRRYAITRSIGAMTSTPSLDVFASVKKMADDKAELEARVKALALELVRMKAEFVTPTEHNAVYLLSDAGMEEMREFSNVAISRVGGILVAISGNDGEYKYVISSGSVDLRAKAKEINAALLGKGGGRPEMISGSFAASYSEIEEYFSK